MQHLEPDRLVLLALSEEPADPAESDHLATCAGCRHELESLRTVAGVGGEGHDLRDLPPPPEHLWQAIEAEIARPAPVVDLAARRDATHQARRSHDTARHPRRRLPAPLVAAAAAAVLAVAGTVVVGRFLERTPAEQVTARATLTPLPTVPADAGGSARVLSDGRIRIEVRNLPSTTGFHEVWLIDPDDPSKMVAVGSLPGAAEVTLPVPPGTELSRYRLVDVSDEPHDGDVTHSGRSLLRGTLTT